MPEDYVFQRAGADGTPTDVRLSELFAPGKNSLVIYSMMFPRYSSDERALRLRGSRHSTARHATD